MIQQKHAVSLVTVLLTVLFIKKFIGDSIIDKNMRFLATFRAAKTEEIVTIVTISHLILQMLPILLLVPKRGTVTTMSQDLFKTDKETSGCSVKLTAKYC